MSLFSPSGSAAEHVNRDVFIFVNGILTSPGNSRAWTDRGVQWMNNYAADGTVSDKFEYFTPALLRRFFQARNAANLAETLAQYPGGRLHLVGHSNGCDLIARAIRLTSAPIASVHLIAAALERDFSKNGLGERLQRGQIGGVFCLCSRADQVLRYAARFSQIASLGLLGYGDLGYRGASAPVPPRVYHSWRSMGHSEWFAGPNFDSTMRAVLSQAIHTQEFAGRA